MRLPNAKYWKSLGDEMIVNVDRDPKYSLYYIGANILELLKSNNGNLSIEEIYNKLQGVIGKNLQIDFVYYSLDWLYLISLITLKEDRVMRL